MTKRAWKLYFTLLALGIAAAIIAYLSGMYWPVLNAPMAAHAKDTIFAPTPHELRSAWWALALFRAERAGYLFGTACAVAAFVVALRAQLKAAA